MNIKIAIYKQGFLSDELLERIKGRVEKMGSTEQQRKEAVQDMEMTVYLKWLLDWVKQLDGDGKSGLRRYVKEHEEEDNPLMEFLVSKYGKEELMKDLEGLVDETVEEEGS